LNTRLRLKESRK